MAKFNKTRFGLTAIKKLYEGYATYKAWLDEENETHSLNIGSVVDALLVNDESFDKLFFVKPEFDEDGKVFALSKKGKQETAEKKAQGITCITEKDFQLCKAIADSFKNHPQTRWIFENHDDYLVKFQEFFSVEFELADGSVIELGAKPDITVRRKSDMKVVAWFDLKTTCKTLHEDFIFQFKALDYDIQAGLYTKVMKKAGVLDLEQNFALNKNFTYPIGYLGVSTKAPYSVFPTMLSDSVIQRGWGKVLNALDNLVEGREKEKNNSFVGYNAVMTIEDSNNKPDLSALNVDEDGLMDFDF